MKRPTDDEMDTAILWLESNEGEGGERDACTRVAAWLESLLERKMARDAGCTVAYFRKYLKAASEMSHE